MEKENKDPDDDGDRLLDQDDEFVQPDVPAEDWNDDGDDDDD